MAMFIYGMIVGMCAVGIWWHLRFRKELNYELICLLWTHCSEFRYTRRQFEVVKEDLLSGRRKFASPHKDYLLAMLALYTVDDYVKEKDRQRFHACF